MFYQKEFGNIKDFGSNKGARYKYLEKGDKIINAIKTKELLNYSFQNNTLPPTFANNTTIDLSKVEHKLDKLVNKSEITIIEDMHGKRVYEKMQNSTMLLKNNRLHLKSRNVRA